MLRKLKLVGLSNIIIFLTFLSCCNITPPEKSNEPDQILVFTRNNEIWTYELPSNISNKIVDVDELLYINSLGTPFYRLWAGQAQWSPQGNKIVFIESVADDISNLKVLNIDTGEQYFFPDSVFRQDTNPSWSIDGSAIFYVSSVLHIGGSFEIFKIDADGQNEQQLTSNVFTSSSPSVDRYNSTIVFSAEDTNETFQLFKMDYDGSNLVQLTFHTPGFRDHHSTPQFSPTSDDLVYSASVGDSSYHDIYLVHNLDFTHAVQLTHSDSSDGDPSWSNDGKYIVFTRYEDQNHRLINPTIWMMTSGGLQQHKIIDDGTQADLWINHNLEDR